MASFRGWHLSHTLDPLLTLARLDVVVADCAARRADNQSPCWPPKSDGPFRCSSGARRPSSAHFCVTPALSMSQSLACRKSRFVTAKSSNHAAILLSMLPPPPPPLAQQAIAQTGQSEGDHHRIARSRYSSGCLTQPRTIGACCS